MPQETFVDASAWIAVVVAKDERHVEATRVFRRAMAAHTALVTTNLVVAETYVSILRELNHRIAMGFLDIVHSTHRLTVVHSTADIEERAERLLAQYADQDFSYVDAVSFTVMRERGIAEAFTFDHHFMTAGFVVVPPRP